LVGRRIGIGVLPEGQELLSGVAGAGGVSVFQFTLPFQATTSASTLPHVVGVVEDDEHSVARSR